MYLSTVNTVFTISNNTYIQTDRSGTDQTQSVLIMDQTSFCTEMKTLMVSDLWWKQVKIRRAAGCEREEGRDGLKRVVSWCVCIHMWTIFVVLVVYSRALDLKWNSDWVRLKSLKCIQVHGRSHPYWVNRARLVVLFIHRPPTLGQCSGTIMLNILTGQPRSVFCQNNGIYLTGKVSKRSSTQLSMFFTCWGPDWRQKAP